MEHVLDDTGRITGARLIKAVGDLPAGTAIDYEGVWAHVQVQEQRRRPQDLIEKYGADTARCTPCLLRPPEGHAE